MHIENLKFYNYRNIENSHIDLNKSVNIFLGKNGQGKTNILESIYLLTNGGIFRPGHSEVLVNNSTNIPDCMLKAEINKNKFNQEIKFQYINSRKSISLNNKKISSMNVTKTFRSILFSPESLSAIKNGAEERRKLIDDFLFISNPNNIEFINEYKKILKSRNKTFKDYKSGLISKNEAINVIESLNPSFLKVATFLTQNRINLIQEIIEKVKQIFCHISQNNVDISVEYLISSNNGVDWTESEVYNNLLIRLKELFFREFEAGLTLVGPHKHDIKFLVDGKDSRYFCSQGQQRALILSFKMAQVLLYKEINGQYPILLLDDVLSELDYEKRTFLIDFLNDIESQIFITTTDLYFKLNDKEMSLRDPAVLRGDLSIYKINRGQILKD